MRIGFLLPGTFATAHHYSGVRQQAILQAEAIESLGHDVVRLNPWNRTQARDLDIVHAFGCGSSLYGIENARIKHLVLSPIIDSNSPFWLYRCSELVGRLPRIHTPQNEMRKQFNVASAVIARSTQEQRQIVRGLGISERKVPIVLNGASYSTTADPTLARRKLNLGEDFIFHLSNITNRVKNVLAMVHAVGSMGIRLVIAGSAHECAALQAIRAAAGRYPNITILGNISSELRDSLYAACRVFCLPSLFEGTGLVAVEAAAQGAAVVITSNGGPPDYFQDMVDYVHKGTEAEIARAVDNAWNRSDSHKTRLQSHVRTNLTWIASAQSLLKTYETLIAQSYVNWSKVTNAT